jgi:hypothetical protein
MTHVLGRLRRSRRARLALVAAGVLLVLALSRAWLGEQLETPVASELAGIAGGLVIAACILVLPRRRARAIRRPPGPR